MFWHEPTLTSTLAAAQDMTVQLFEIFQMVCP
jgi:hypothetical protein